MIVEASRRHGAALFWIVAIACFLAASAAIAARVSVRAADLYAASLRGAFIVRIVAPDAPDTLTAAARDLQTIKGVSAARPVTPERAAQLLRRWTGPVIKASDLPPLHLIELQLEQNAAAPGFALTLQRALANMNYQSEVYGPGQWAVTSAHQAIWFRNIAVMLAAALGVTALLMAGLAGRARVSGEADLIAPLADLGATRIQVTAPFAARSALEGFMAGLLGAAAALASSAWVLAQLLPNVAFSDWSRLFAAEDAAPVAAAPLLAALLAAAGARTAASRAFSRAARYA